MKSLRLLTIASSALLLSACSSMFLGEDNAEPPVALPDFEQSLNPIEAWDASVGSGSQGRRANLVVAVKDGRLYGADHDGEVFAFDAQSGDRLWSSDTDQPIGGGVGVGEGLVLVGTSEGEVLALDAESGKLRWRARVSSEVLSVPRAAEGVVIAHTNDGKLFGIDATSGKRLWIYDRTVPTLTLRGTSSPVLAPGMVISGFASGKLTAINLRDGQPNWEQSITVPRGRSELERMVDIDSDPLVIGGDVYVSTYQGRVASLGLNSGKLHWVRDLPSRAGLAADYSQAYVTDDDGHVWALERGTGRSLWKQDKLTRRGVTGPAVLGNYVVVGDYEGYLHWMDRDDGRLVARSRVDSSGIMAQPLVVDDTLYVLGSGGDLSAFRLKE